jgi:hypothetical protein
MITSLIRAIRGQKSPSGRSDFAPFAVKFLCFNTLSCILPVLGDQRNQAQSRLIKVNQGKSICLGQLKLTPSSLLLFEVPNRQGTKKSCDLSPE